MGLHDVPLPLCMHFLLQFYLRAICPNKCVIKINILLYPTILDSSVKTQYVHIYMYSTNTIQKSSLQIKGKMIKNMDQLTTK
jgi:hypothetical protein